MRPVRRSATGGVRLGEAYVEPAGALTIATSFRDNIVFWTGLFYK